ncbi:DUF3540 domain-containing protein [Enterobacteriaceae bacterium 4M9]|nr:DUF3540 domain-containing protein [Enterobacteriaceae bacterium 4M9]
MSEHIHVLPARTACRPVSGCATPSVTAAHAPLITGFICQRTGQLRMDVYPALTVQVAPGCLLLPQPGDLVSAVLHDDQVFVIAVLQRLDATAPLVLNAGEAALHLVAPSLTLHGTESVEIQTDRLSLLTRTSRWVADTLHQVAQSLFVRASHAQRKVEYVDEVEARHISQNAGQSLALNARMGSINASTVLKIDGGQIHMG